MKHKLTRRELATSVLSTAAAQAMPQAPATADEELKAARDRLKAAGDTLAKQAVPMATEPAFQFRAS